MRFALLAALIAACGPGDTSTGDPAEDQTPPGGKADSEPSVPDRVWRFSSPAGLQQLSEEDVAHTDSARFAIRGWDQVATIASPDGTATVRIVPRRGALAPRRILTEATGNRSLAWLLTPLGVVWHNPVLWDDGVVQSPGRLLYHLVEGGLLATTMTGVADGTTLTAELSQSPTSIDPTVFELGGIRLRVVAGTPSVTGNVLSIAPVANTVQLIGYTDAFYDTAEVNAIGALTTPVDGRVSVLPGAVAEKHIRFKSEALGLDTVIGLGSTPLDGPGPVVLADRATLFVGTGAETSGWRIVSLSVKIIKEGILGMRRMRYHQPDEAAGTSVGGQTFNFYVFSPRGTVTLWTVGRITEPYELSLYTAGTSNVVLAHFPATENDYSEDLSTGHNAMSTHTAWAFDHDTLIEGSALQANAPLHHTGEEGNSVDGGWRNVVIGTFDKVLVGGAGGFTQKTPPANNYRYDNGDATQAMFSAFSVFHRQRSWTGAWSERPNRIASLKMPTGAIFGHMKSLHNTDVLAAGSRFEVNQVVSTRTGVVPDPSQLYTEYALDGVPLRNGMLDLDHGAMIRASWDLAIRGDQVSVVIASP
jgi:hypothetical protein